MKSWNQNHGMNLQQHSTHRMICIFGNSYIFVIHIVLLLSYRFSLQNLNCYSAKTTDELHSIPYNLSDLSSSPITNEGDLRFESQKLYKSEEYCIKK
jgi:hypothetical protein